MIYSDVIGPFKEFKFGNPKRCKGCNQLVLRKSGPRGPKPKFCTHKCYKRFHRRKDYLKTQEKAKEYSRLFRLSHPEYIKERNAYYRNKRKEKINWKYNYLESLVRA